MTTLQVRVKGRAIDTYFHENKVYVEGRKGSEYTLFINNPSSIRKKVVLSVDGLNVMTGDKTWERAYVVEPWGSLEVPGWRHDGNSTKAFFFSSAKGSYNEHNEAGEAKNIGVIGALVYNEKPKPVAVPTVTVHHHHDYWPKPYWPPYYPYIGGVYYNTLGTLRGYDNVNISTTLGNAVQDAGFNSVATASAGGGEEYTSGTIAANFLAQQGEARNLQQSYKSAIRDRARGFAGGQESVKMARSLSANAGEVGTGYGRTKEFKTTQVYYDFEDQPSETLLIYYESKQYLLQEGIMQRRSRPVRDREAFPGYVADGCPAPKYVRKRR